MIKRFAPVPFENSIVKKNYTLNDDLRIYEEALKENNLINVSMLDVKTFYEISVILNHYLCKSKNGKFDINSNEVLKDLKSTLDKYTKVEWVGAKTQHGGRFFYAFTEYELPKDIKKAIRMKYKFITKQNLKTKEATLEK